MKSAMLPMRYHKPRPRGSMSRWKVLSSETVFGAGFFRLRRERCELPDGRVMPSYYVTEFQDWVNVVPVTEEGEIVLVEQYRHAAGEVFLEIPGGATHGSGEDPELAGRRELLEETGFEGREWIYCGDQFPNPAVQTNRLHTYLAFGCRRVAEPNLDPFEDLQTRVLPLKELYGKLERGELKHSLIANSLYLARPHLIRRGLLG